MNATLVLLSKVTVVLAMAWIFHAILARSNPRWRVLVWRMTALAMLAVAALSLAPPLVNLRLLRPRQAMENTSAIESTHLDAGETMRDVSFTAARTTPPPASEGAAARQAPAIAQEGTSADHGPPGQPPSSDDACDATGERAETTAAHLAPRTLSLAALALTCWSIGALVGILWTAVGIVRLRLIRTDSFAVPGWVAGEATVAAARLQLRRAFRIVQTKRLATPCLIGVWRPLVLLPSCQCEAARREELGAILAHELAHLKGNDPAFNLLLHALSIALWFHPLIWLARRAHVDACDYVCDALAAGCIKDADFYVCILARLALRLAEQPKVVGLAMARSSRVLHRIEAMRRQTGIISLPKWRVAAAVAVVAAASLLWGGLTISETIAEPPTAARQSPDKATASKTENNHAAKETEPNAPDKTNQTTLIQAVSADTDEPLAGAGLRFGGRIGGQNFNQFVTTDRDGQARLTWPAKEEINHLWMTAAKAGFVSIHHVWRGEQQKIEMPARIDLRFDEGTQIGGMVEDEKGRPIAGASLDVSMPVTWPKLANYMFTAATLNTDADGHWTWDDAPADIGAVGIRVEHADYLSGYSTANRGLSNVAVLKQGLQVAGQVVDRDGKAVAGAQARLGFSRFGTNEPEATTDAQGRFVLKNCKPGRSLVTVQGEGFSPTFQELALSEETKDLRFELQPGHTLSVQVTDVNGKALNEVWVVSDTWRGYRTLKLSARTDAQGKAVFRSAPDDAVLFDLLKSGYMSARRTPLAASAETHKVTLYPELTIGGRVTDAVSHQPVKKFRLRHGWRSANRDDVSWSRDEPTLFEKGEYDIKFDEPMEGHVLQVVADGYLPATSRVFRSTEGKQSFDLELKPGNGPTGVVLLADGSPAAGAEVGLATQQNRAVLKSGNFDRHQNQADVVKTGADGRFAFPPQGDEPFLLVIVHDEGYAERLHSEFKPDAPIVLEPWGRIEGLVAMGRKLAPECEVAFVRERAHP
ncbi:MAG TPA: carboxypeptidase regulatory-like domain-containing protein [Pirellulales bacterium]|nr:carboxypeptidase regulatory-like domain-containing protein [Pirellulales bacterium]